ncbi:MAG: MOSC domain-containing protein [Myxococcota bacterium]|nr:MOSC domain-containing protein [Myxococcota bacterium]
MERTLRERLADVPQTGRIEWIGVRPGHGAPILVLDRALALADRGLEGDRVSASLRGGGKRQVTLVQCEHLDVIARLLGRDRPVEPVLLRRNLVVAGINLRSLERMRFAIGAEVVLEGTGPCEPCAKMDHALGEGAFHAMRGHGGITARVISGGPIGIGDPVRPIARTDE